MKFWHSRHNPRVKLTQHEMQGISQEIRQEFAPKSAINDPELVLLPVDPYHLYAYWNFDENKSDGLTHRGASNELALRVYWRPQESQQIHNSKLWFDVGVQSNHNQQKVRLPMDATAYSAAIGKYFSGHEFVPYATSNIIHVPCARVALPEPEAAVLESKKLSPRNMPSKENNHRESGADYYDETLIDTKINDVLGRAGFNNREEAEEEPRLNFFLESGEEGYFDERQIDAEIKSTLYAKGIDISLCGATNNSEKSHYASKNASGQGNIN